MGAVRREPKPKQTTTQQSMGAARIGSVTAVGTTTILQQPAPTAAMDYHAADAAEKVTAQENVAPKISTANAAAIRAIPKTNASGQAMPAEAAER